MFRLVQFSSNLKLINSQPDGDVISKQDSIAVFFVQINRHFPIEQFLFLYYVEFMKDETLQIILKEFSFFHEQFNIIHNQFNLFHEQFNLIQEQFNQMRVEISQVRIEISEIRSEIVELRSEIKDMRSEINGIKNEISELKTENSGIRTEIKGIKGEMKLLGNKVDECVQVVKDFTNFNFITENDLKRFAKANNLEFKYS